LKKDNKVKWKPVKLLTGLEPALFGDEWALEVETDIAGRQILFFDTYEEGELYINDFSGENNYE